MSGLPQVFVSYARPDQKRVARLVTALRGAGFDAWWDDDIPAGASWEQTIEKALEEAQAVIVAWSPTSVASENVRSEARVARARGRLVQIFLEPCEPPLFFGERQGIDLSSWRGSARDPAFLRLQEALRAAMSSERAILRSPPRRKMLLPLPLAAVAALIAVAMLAGWWWMRQSPEPAATPAVAPPAAIEAKSAVNNAASAAPAKRHTGTAEADRLQVSRPAPVRSRPQPDQSQPREDELPNPPQPPAPPPKTPSE